MVDTTGLNKERLGGPENQRSNKESIVNPYANGVEKLKGKLYEIYGQPFLDYAQGKNPAITIKALEVMATDASEPVESKAPKSDISLSTILGYLKFADIDPTPEEAVVSDVAELIFNYIHPSKEFVIDVEQFLKDNFPSSSKFYKAVLSSIKAQQSNQISSSAHNKAETIHGTYEFSGDTTIAAKLANNLSHEVANAELGENSDSIKNKVLTLTTLLNITAENGFTRTEIKFPQIIEILKLIQTEISESISNDPKNKTLKAADKLINQIAEQANTNLFKI